MVRAVMTRNSKTVLGANIREFLKSDAGADKDKGEGHSAYMGSDTVTRVGGRVWMTSRVDEPRRILHYGHHFVLGGLQSGVRSRL